MKYNKCCPKCQNTEIAIIEGGTFKGNIYNTISTGLNTIFLTRYLCTSCGYTENYLDDANDIKKLKDKFIRHSDASDFV